MASKCSAISDHVDKMKIVRKSLPLDIKLDISNRHNHGQGSSIISKTLRLAQLTLPTLLKVQGRLEVLCACLRIW